MSMNAFELFLTQIVAEFNLDKTKLNEMWQNILNKKCDYVVKKGMDGEHICGKNVKLDGKCYRHLPTDKTMKDPSKCCSHIVKKKNGDEEQCNRLAKKNGLCNKHTKAKEAEQNVKVCSHIIKKKDGTEENCTRKAVDDTDVCKKHTKKTNLLVNESENEEEEETNSGSGSVVLEEVVKTTEKTVEVESDEEELVKTAEFKPQTPVYCQVEKCKKVIEDGEKKCEKHLKSSKKTTKSVPKSKKIVDMSPKEVEENYDNLF